MQRWYALESSRGEPYALYAASNLGSFAGLISYPLLVEPLLTLQQQSLLWTGGYALLVLLVAGCALTIPPRAVEAAPAERSPTPSRRRILHWMALAAIPSGLMLSTSTHLTTDIVAVPLLWVLPLGLYLLSFVVAFARRRGPTEFITQIAPLIILIAGGLAFSDGSHRPIFSATLGLSLLFTVAVTVHGEMYRLRPAADHLTSFYLSMSVGGVIGGAFCAILAPMLFDWTYEHPLLVLAAALLIPQRNYVRAIERFWVRRGVRIFLTLSLPTIVLVASLFGDQRFWPGVPYWAAIASPVLIGIAALLSIGRPAMFAMCLLALMMSYGGWSTLKLTLGDTRTRSYFGVYTVSTRPSGSARVLTHGTTVHGVQSLRPGLSQEPTSYYTRMSGVGLAMAAAEPLYGPRARIGVVGLGTGTLACYRVPGQSWTFFEIDPAMVRIARDPKRFTFLSGCAPDARVVLGDARLTLARQPAGGLDLLAIDAFSSDAVPMHLLTREALGVYGQALGRSGLLLMHISNRYLDLKPVLAGNAAREGWQARILRYSPTAEEMALENAHPSVWVALSRDPAILDSLVRSGPDQGWARLRADPDFPGWSDDYASIIPLLRGLTQ
jgi:CDP-diglyceride synthetase